MGNGIEPGCGNDVVREWLAGNDSARRVENGSCGIVNDAVRAAEVAIGLTRLRHRREVNRRGGNPRSLVVHKKEEFVAQDRAAERASVLVALQHRTRQALLVVEKVVRIEVGIAHVIVERAVELIGPALTDDADDSTGVAAVFGCIGAFENAECSYAGRS